LQLLASVITNAIGKLKSAQSAIGDGKGIERITNGAVDAFVPKVPGHCLCRKDGCEPKDIWTEVQNLVSSHFGKTLASTLQTFLTGTIANLKTALEQLKTGFLQDLAGAKGVIIAQTASLLTTLSGSATHLQNPEVCADAFDELLEPAAVQKEAWSP